MTSKSSEKFKPKLLISLILVYLLGFISNIVKNILLIENFFLTLLISGTILIAIIYSLEKLVFGNKSKNGTGIISKWMQHQMRKVANTLIDDSYNKNILHNTELMQEQSSELVKQHRENINLFFIDAIIFCIVFCYILRTSNLYYGTIFILPSGFMLYYKIKKGIDSFNIILSANKYAYLSRKKVKRSNQYI